MNSAGARHRDRVALSIWVRIAKLVIICVLPGWLLASVLSVYIYRDERAEVARDAVNAARGLIRVVEQDVQADLAAMTVLATSRRLDNNDFAAFYRKAEEVIKHTSGRTVILSDLSGQQLVNLLRPYGAALPPYDNPENLRRVVQSGKPAVSDLYFGSTDRRPLVSVDVPVIRDDQVIYGLALSIDSSHLSDLLRRQKLPQNWVVSIIDSSGTILARDRAAGEFVGKKAAPALLQRLREAEEDTVETTTLENISVMAAFSKSTTLGWSVAVGVPEADATSNLIRWLAIYGGGAGSFLLVGLWLAGIVGRRIANPVQSLVQPALAIGRGEYISIPPLGLKEADEVAQAMLQAQELLRQREAEFRAAFDISSVGMCESDPNTRRFVRVNRRLCNMLGYGENELLQLTFIEMTHPEDRGASEEGITRLARGEITEFRAEKRYLCKDGRSIWCDVTVNLIRNAEGRPERAVAIIQDISDNKRIQDELSEAKVTAETANRAKSAFLANISHEIRTPLHNILGLAQLLQRETTDPKRRRRLDDLGSSAEHLLDVINSVLDLSKIEADQMRLEQGDFFLKHVLDRVMPVVASLAREKGLNLVLDVQASIRTTPLRGDALRLGQVLINLISNAVKFTDSGSVILSVLCLGEDASGLTLKFSVKDTGIGIAAANQCRLFDAFEQADSSSDRKYGGSGLGLTISDRLVRAMGGEIKIESELGVGSTFSFEIKLPRGTYVEENEAVAPESSHMRFADSLVLVAEDHPLSRELMAQMLAEFGCNVSIARDGAEAIEHARERAYDLIIMDLQMPVLDGIAATIAIRKLPGHERTPILAITANAFAEDKERCMQAGMNGHLSKPLTAASLADALRHWLAESSDSGTLADSQASDAGEDTMRSVEHGTNAILLGAVGRGLTREFILSEFLRLHRDDLAQVRAHLADGDVDAARRLVHTLEGASAMIGAHKVRTAVAQLGAALRASADTRTVDIWLAGCETELALLAAAGSVVR